jgi:hypothetical protein
MRYVCFTACLIVTAAPAWSAIVYDRPASYSGGPTCPCWTSSFGASDGGGFQAFDNFQLGAAAGIGAVSWQGTHWDFQTPGSNPVGPDTTSWTTEFCSDAGDRAFTLGTAAEPVPSALFGIALAALVLRRLSSRSEHRRRTARWPHRRP